ncbi:MAG: SCO family protein [Vitreoscilla sp.]|nr:SCO family protein [Burkholderiales bacterium]MBP6338626.1 SCO family protein [Vitreoscilla sp.]MBP6674955.1 SCO family protein [Vitreoscilla sp.]
MAASPLARRLFLLGVGTALAGAGLIWKNVRRRDSAEALATPPAMKTVTEVNDQFAVPEFEGRNLAGVVNRGSLMGRWSMVFFGYTQCPDVCPTALTLMAEMARRLSPAERPQVLFISIDPQRDTPELLAAYIPSFDASFVGAAGTDESLAALVKHLGVMYQRNPESKPGIYTVDHTAAMFLIDPQARLKALFSPPHDLEAMLADYRRLTH